jgi:heptosyltransferase I
VQAARLPLLDLTGQDTLKQLCAVLERCAALISPDSGPAHIANALGRPVLGLYAATDPRRSGPYDSLRWTIDRYDAAARSVLGRPATALRWGTKIERPGVMALIEVPAVLERLEALDAETRAA